MKAFIPFLIVVVGLNSLPPPQQESRIAHSATPELRSMSFRRHVLPILRRRCLPCHASESNNPSELSLDSLQLIMVGGLHGASIHPGRPESSSLYQKLSPDPPFGKRMPISPRKKSNGPGDSPLPTAEIRIIGEWINQGARDN
jgi:hypothetical protein